VILLGLVATVDLSRRGSGLYRCERFNDRLLVHGLSGHGIAFTRLGCSPTRGCASL